MKVLSFLGAVGFGVFAGVWLVELRQKRIAAMRPLNINEASEDEIILRLGLPPEIAGRIVEHRPYPTKIDLLGRLVVPQELYESIKHRIAS
jgi:DNA uptake protein ComE-like DNA-binding protein